MTPDPVDIPATVTSLKALANPARLRVALLLLAGEKAVSQIEAELGLRQPGLSQHLAELRDAGLVVTRREARSVFYALADGPSRLLLSALAGGSAVPASARLPNLPGPFFAAARFAVVEGRAAAPRPLP